MPVNFSFYQLSIAYCQLYNVYIFYYQLSALHIFNSMIKVYFQYTFKNNLFFLHGQFPDHRPHEGAPEAPTLMSYLK